MIFLFYKKFNYKYILYYIILMKKYITNVKFFFSSKICNIPRDTLVQTRTHKTKDESRM